MSGGTSTKPIFSQFWTLLCNTYKQKRFKFCIYVHENFIQRMVLNVKNCTIYHIDYNLDLFFIKASNEKYNILNIIYKTPLDLCPYV